MINNELLLVISNIVQSQVEPIRHDIKEVELSIENKIMLRLNIIESCYAFIYRKYTAGVNQIEA